MLRSLVPLLFVFPMAAQAQQGFEKLNDCVAYHATMMEPLVESMEELARVIVRGLCDHEVVRYSEQNSVSSNIVEALAERRALFYLGEARLTRHGIELYDHDPAYLWGGHQRN